METDAVVAARLVAGDPDALREVVARLGPLIYGLAVRVTANGAVAEDVAQEVFVELWRRPDRFDPARGSLRAYLAVQAHRRAVDVVRSTVRRTQREQRHLADAAPEGEAAQCPGPDGEAADADTAARVRAAVNRLPAPQRIVVEMAYFGGRTLRELAAELGIPEGTAKSRLRLAQARLRSLLSRELVELA
jgi:RNA polymerase sigma-70 factor (ECF subfamily)